MSSPVPQPVAAGPPAARGGGGSAGGVVVDVDGGAARIAVIARRNRAGRVEWCLPKGHIEGERDARAGRRARGGRGDRHHRAGADRARHHRLLVRHGRPAGAQVRAPLPARGHRRRADHRGRPRPRGHRRRVVPAARGRTSTSPSPTSGGSPRWPGSGWQARRDPLAPTRPPRSDRRATRRPHAGRRCARHRATGLCLSARRCRSPPQPPDDACARIARHDRAPAAADPVTVTLGGVSPTIARPGDPVVVTGTLRNTGTTTIDTATVHARLSTQGLQTRDGVRRWAAGGRPAGRRLRGRQPGPARRAAGRAHRAVPPDHPRRRRPQR